MSAVILFITEEVLLGALNIVILNGFIVMRDDLLGPVVEGVVLALHKLV